MLEEGGLIHNWMCYFKNGHKMTHRAFGNEVLWCSSICGGDTYHSSSVASVPVPMVWLSVKISRNLRH